MTTYFPISFTVPQYEDSSGTPYSGAVLKAYSAGTSTPISMATDFAGGTLVGSIALNASGFPEVSGNVVIPHIAENYKLALYPTQSAADANTGEIWSIDNIQISSSVSSGALTPVASATTINLNSTATDYFNITGTTTIAAITLAEGVEVTCKFASILSITNSASLINIGGADITTAAGDITVLRGEAGGVVRMINYVKTSGESVVAGSAGLTLLGSYTASADTSVDIYSGSAQLDAAIDSTYDEYVITITGAVPATDATSLYMRTSTDTGVSFDAGASNYTYWGVLGVSSSSTPSGFNSSGATQILITGNVTGSAAGENLSAYIRLSGPSNASNFTFTQFDAVNMSAATTQYFSSGGAARIAAEVVDGVRFLMSSGNITSGEFKLYGVKKS